VGLGELDDLFDADKGVAVAAEVTRAALPTLESVT
jgi:hypothetical protein